jgi:hypothetical protein
MKPPLCPWGSNASALVECRGIRSRWIEAFRLAVDVDDAELRAARDDLENELLLRREEAPYDLVRDALDRFIARATETARQIEQDPKRTGELDRQFAADQRRFEASVRGQKH